MTAAQGLFSELRRRKVIHTAVVYAALAWAGIEVATTLIPVYGGGDTMVRIVVGLIILGLPVAIVVPGCSTSHRAASDVTMVGPPKR